MLTRAHINLTRDSLGELSGASIDAAMQPLGPIAMVTPLQQPPTFDPTRLSPQVNYFK